MSNIKTVEALFTVSWYIYLPYQQILQATQFPIYRRSRELIPNFIGDILYSIVRNVGSQTAKMSLTRLHFPLG